MFQDQRPFRGTTDKSANTSLGYPAFSANRPSSSESDSQSFERVLVGELVTSRATNSDITSKRRRRFVGESCLPPTAAALLTNAGIGELMELMSDETEVRVEKAEVLRICGNTCSTVEGDETSPG
jgi:hypothetical protein